MKKLINCAVSLLLCVTVVGCSIFRSSTQIIEVQVTDPPGAQIWIKRVYVGESSGKQVVRRNQSVDVVIKKEGYVTMQKIVGYHLNVTGVLDIAGAWLFLLPIIGVLSPGANSLDTTLLVVKLAPEMKPVESTNSPPVETK